MIVHHKSGCKGVLVDRGTGRRIPFATWFDAETGEYEAIRATPDGRHYAVDENENAVLYRGRAVGKLELLPLAQAHQFGWQEAVKVPSGRIRLTVDEKEAGLQQYKEVYVKVWQFRGEARRVVDDRWENYLRDNAFFDDLIITRLKRRFTRSS